jgi:hypothetical protein
VSDGKWSGGAANRSWSRGTSVTGWPGDAERSERLFEALASEMFLCEVCGRTHPLDEHTLCRRAKSAAILADRQ